MSSTQQLLLAEGAGGGAAPVYIEDVFQTWLYTGNGSTQTITNNIDLSTKGGMVWIKCRNTAYGHRVNDTVRGASKFLTTNSTAAEDTNASVLTAFTSSGFSVGASTAVNENAATYASWTFREQPKFFDVVTYTGDGTTPRSIPHNLGSTPGCVIIKMLSTSADWYVYHRGLPTTTGTYIRLNSTSSTNANPVIFPASPVNSTAFKVGSGADVNGSGSTYVAYVFAHDAGGFGLTGTDNVISCGSYTGNGSATGPVVTLGYEPQWLMIKNASVAGEDWFIVDTMRGFTANTTGGSTVELSPNSAGVEDSQFKLAPTATGFQVLDSNANVNGSGNTMIYIAIRRGPMKVPTSATTVFTPFYFSGNDSTSRQLSAGFPADAFLGKRAIGDVSPFVDRLRGKDLLLYTPLDSAEAASSLYCRFDSNSGPIVGWNAAAGININGTGWNYRAYAYGRAPGFFDVVCYTGTGANRTVSHNLGAVPELMLVKARSTAGYSWCVYSATLGPTYVAFLNATGAFLGSAVQWNSTTPTSSVFSVSTNVAVNGSGTTFVAYLFATCAGVSKVGSYTGTGTTLQINCGFTAGSRFVLIKRTDSTGAWYVWDSARGIVSGNDPYFLLNSSDEEVTNTDYVDTYNAGFEISDTAPAAINASGGTYIFLAIA
jgi:hypothetical protein